MTDGCCCFTWNIYIAYSGLLLSLAEIILASIYNFHFMGLLMGVIALIASAVYIFFIKREQNGDKYVPDHNIADSP